MTTRYSRGPGKWRVGVCVCVCVCAHACMCVCVCRCAGVGEDVGVICDLYTIQTTVAFCFPSTFSTTLNIFYPHHTTLSTSHHSPQHTTLSTTHHTPQHTHHTLHITPRSPQYNTLHSSHHTTHYTPQEFEASLSELTPRGSLSGQVPERQLLSSKLEFKFNSALANLCSDCPSWKHQLEETLLQLGQIHEL